MGRSIMALLLGVSVLLLPSTAGAEPMPLLEEALDGPAWSTYALRANAEELQLFATAHATRYPAHVGAYLYDDTGRLVLGVTQTILSGNTGVYVDAHPAPGGDIHVDQRDPKPNGPFALAAGVGTSGQDARSSGIVLAAVWAAGAVERVDVRITGGAGAELVRHADTGAPAVERGTEAYLFTTEDFSGVAQAQGGASVPPFRTAVRATALTEVAIDVQRTFVGLYNVGFASPIPGAPAGFPLQTNADMSVQDPNGTRNCPCVWTSFAQDDFGPPGGPGRYTFRNTGVGTVGGAGEVFIGGADLRLPKLP